ncbi:expressed unknown protein [Seminavis robusta]|uniref:Fungal lipase-type domain-containing protein n=1 Tax=Seminavis robusta TaxID=568900 RepID=A0A9N8E9R9_9STRA|nr:expressed unknown protein [Seminavis robusta]|eukprot:Sro703_g190080.1 n/a (379) ;mRNA; f:8757-10328
MHVFGLWSFVWFSVLLTTKKTCKVHARVGDHESSPPGDETLAQLPELNNPHSSSHPEQRNLQTSQCPSVYPDPSEIKLLLSKEFFVNYVNQSLYISDIIKAQDYGPIEDLVPELEKVYERVDAFSDIDDQALIVKTKDTQLCFAAFQASDRGDRMVEGWIGYILDQWHNINPFTYKIKGTDCKIRQGTFDAYNTTYKVDFRRALNACVESCGDEQCPLVLAGDSQGGAVAMAAAIDVTQLYDPTVITFAAPKALVKSMPCSILNTEKHFRFVNTDVQGRYDLVVNQVNIFNEKHTGWTLLLDDINFPLGSPGLDDSRDRCPGTNDLHEYTIYRDRVQAIIDRDCFPLPVGGWPDGHYCRFDDECQTNQCHQRRCKRGL